MESSLILLDFACSQEGSLGHGDPTSFSLSQRPRAGTSGTTSEELYLLLRMNTDPEAAEKFYRLKHGESSLPEAEKEKGEIQEGSSIKKESSDMKKGESKAASTPGGAAGGEKTRGKGELVKSLTGFEGQRRGKKNKSEEDAIECSDR